MVKNLSPLFLILVTGLLVCCFNSDIKKSQNPILNQKQESVFLPSATQRLLKFKLNVIQNRTLKPSGGEVGVVQANIQVTLQNTKKVQIEVVSQQYNVAKKMVNFVGNSALHVRFPKSGSSLSTSTETPDGAKDFAQLAAPIGGFKNLSIITDIPSGEKSIDVYYEVNGSGNYKEELEMISDAFGGTARTSFLLNKDFWLPECAERIQKVEAICLGKDFTTVKPEFISSKLLLVNLDTREQIEQQELLDIIGSLDPVLGAEGKPRLSTDCPKEKANELISQLKEKLKQKAGSLSDYQKACLVACVSSRIIEFAEKIEGGADAGKCLTAVESIALGSGVCRQFAYIYRAFAVDLGLNVIVVIGEEPSGQSGFQHAVNQLKINGATYLFEPQGDRCQFFK